MPRNGGAVVDTEMRQVCDRNALWYPLDELVVDGGTLYYARPIEGNALFSYHWRWLLPEQAWVINRFRFHAHVLDPMDWYIETDLIDVDGPLWRVRDGYLDIEVFEGVRYELRDADELAEGLATGDIPLAETIIALESLNRLCVALRRHRFSGWSLLEEFAPGLGRRT
jgi:predicted RNA-binding protein associated with RNAse of E/G family